jgi:hypothetical protein
VSDEPLPAGIPIFRLLGFLAMGLLLHTALYLAYTRGVASGHKAIRADRAFLRQAPQQIEMLVVGDSHPRTGIDAKILGDRVVNTAIGGQHYLKMLYRVRRLIDGTGRDIDALLLPLDAASFSSWNAESFAPEYVWGRYVDFWEVGRVRGQPWSNVGRWLKARFFPYGGELRTLNQLRTKRFGFGETLPMGSFNAYSEGERNAMALATAKEHLQGAEVVDPGMKWAFQQIVAWADSKGAKVVAVSFPVSAEYDFWVSRVDAYNKTRAEILPEFLSNPNHFYIDHHDLFAERGEFFSDPHHLNTAGRIGYSKYLRTLLVEQGVLW